MTAETLERLLLRAIDNEGPEKVLDMMADLCSKISLASLDEDDKKRWDRISRYVHDAANNVRRMEAE